MNETDEARIRRETIKECTKVVNETFMPSDEWIERWKINNKERYEIDACTHDEVVAFSHADFIAERIRALVEEDND